MKLSKIIVVIALIAFILIGWFAFVRDSAADRVAYQDCLSQAQKNTDAGLYQMAIEDYSRAIEYESTDENWASLLASYEKRLAEDAEISSDYIKALNNAISSCGYQEAFVKRLAELYLDTNNQKKAYDIIVAAAEEKVTSDVLEALKQDAQYTYSIKMREYSSFLPLSYSHYSVYNGKAWASIDTAGTTEFPFQYRYINQVSEDGIGLFTDEKDSRLIDSKGVVRGIFPYAITDAGIYSEGLIAVKKGSSFVYCDSYAEEKFGGYEAAGTFYDGRAAVKKDGQWLIIDNTGQAVSDKRFQDIRLSLDGNYLSASTIIASEKDVYRLYDTKFNVIGDFSCEDIDICTSDGLIAFKSGGKWGFVTTDGQVVIEPQYEDAKSFSNGLAAICKNGKWGFIDRDNRNVIECRFSGADYFNDAGSCLVRTDESGMDDEVIWQMLSLKLGIIGGK
jgi:hypothetical protein